MPYRSTTGQSTTMLSSVRMDGELVFTTFPGAVNGEKFKAYLKKLLIQTLRPGDIVIMDNLRAHKVSGIAELVKSVGAVVLYLSPYSSDLNPIEQIWSNLRSCIQKAVIQVTSSTI